MATRPTKRELKSLVEAYARNIAASEQQAGSRVEQKLYDAFMRKYTRLGDKYPQVDMASHDFWAGLEERAQAWLRSRVARGAGSLW